MGGAGYEWLALFFVARIARPNLTTWDMQDRCDPRTRRILLVGNGPSVLNYSLGRTVDSFPNVVRFHEYQTDGFRRHVGQTTKRWVSSAAHTAELIAAYPERTMPVLVAVPHLRGNCSYADLRRTIGARLMPSQRERIMFVSKETAQSLARRLNAVPSSGLTTIWHFLQTYPLVHIHGFDFFGNSGRVHYFADGRQAARHHNGLLERRLVDELISAGRVQRLSSCYNETASAHSAGDVRANRPIKSRIVRRGVKARRQRLACTHGGG